MKFSDSPLPIVKFLHMTGLHIQFHQLFADQTDQQKIDFLLDITAQEQEELEIKLVSIRSDPEKHIEELTAIENQRIENENKKSKAK